MAAFFLAGITIPRDASGAMGDRGSYEEYIARVKPVVESFGGRYVVRSESIVTFTGDWRPDRIIVIEFPTMEELQSCFASPEYTAIAGLRAKAVHADALIIEG